MYPFTQPGYLQFVYNVCVFDPLSSEPFVGVSSISVTIRRLFLGSSGCSRQQKKFQTFPRQNGTETTKTVASTSIIPDTDTIIWSRKMVGGENSWQTYVWTHTILWLTDQQYTKLYYFRSSHVCWKSHQFRTTITVLRSILRGCYHTTTICELVSQLNLMITCDDIMPCDRPW